MLSLSQADRQVLGADLNRSESSWDASTGPRRQRDVRYNFDSDRAGASHWTHAMRESRTQSAAANELDWRRQRRWGGEAKRLGGGQI
jgi:hypothetical protein